ncbi:hypothetical protein B0T21DRAFT_344980 [Apiosordaria backusii]|uniref:Uncharacterized protein n=1 Tax=Apiosordaria backusii TaxID=314023 RepID=A0AA40ET10_9PEZI|nr:hypothetical protein B0T21DRAFT_344980 [Apiosordaria backusii]
MDLKASTVEILGKQADSYEIPWLPRRTSSRKILKRKANRFLPLATLPDAIKAAADAAATTITTAGARAAQDLTTAVARAVPVPPALPPRLNSLLQRLAERLKEVQDELPYLDELVQGYTTSCQRYSKKNFTKTSMEQASGAAHKQSLLAEWLDETRRRYERKITTSMQQASRAAAKTTPEKTIVRARERCVRPGQISFEILYLQQRLSTVGKLNAPCGCGNYGFCAARCEHIYKIVPHHCGRSKGAFCQKDPALPKPDRVYEVEDEDELMFDDGDANADDDDTSDGQHHMPSMRSQVNFNATVRVRGRRTDSQSLQRFHRQPKLIKANQKSRLSLLHSHHRQGDRSGRHGHWLPRGPSHHGTHGSNHRPHPRQVQQQNLLKPVPTTQRTGPITPNDTSPVSQQPPLIAVFVVNGTVDQTQNSQAISQILAGISASMNKQPNTPAPT